MVSMDDVVVSPRFTFQLHHIPLSYLRHTPDSDGSHTVSKDGEERRGSLGVVSPTQPGGAPEFEELAQADAGNKGQDGRAVTRGFDGNQDARQGSQMVKRCCMVGHTKGSMVARKLGKIIQYSTTKNFRGCLGSVIRSWHERVCKFLVLLASYFNMRLGSLSVICTS